MPTTPSPRTATIRNLALVGQSAAGKTSLVEALLHRAGRIGSLGSLERGSTVSDFDPLERKFQHSLNTSLVSLEHGGARIQLLDTPGLPDFLGQALPALEAVETAAIVLNATVGIEPMAIRMMNWARQRDLCRLIIINKIDAERVDLPGLLTQIQEAFGKECLPLNLPAGGGTQVVDCFFNPAGAADFSSVEAAHRALVEQVVEVDADFVERYLNDGDVDPRELHAPLEQALREGHLVPVCFTSARNGAGIAELLDVMAALMPHPGEGNPPHFLEGEGPQARPVRAEPDADRHVLAHVFKVVSDPYVGKLSLFRVHQGTVTKDSLLYVGDGRKPFKVGHLFAVHGRDHVEIPSAGPGEIAAVAKVDEIHYDAVLHDAAEDSHIHLEPLPFPVPVHGLAIEPKRRGDEQRMWEVLQKLVEEEPCLKVEHVAATNETVIYGLGEMHLRVLLERMTEIYKCEVLTRPPRIAYRETITQSAEGHHRHKKQTGGAGQFGEVFLRIEPLPRGAGFEFIDEVKGGAIPSVFIPAVEKGVRQAMDGGVIAGYPIQDVRVVVYDGKHHSVDSKEIAFITAGRKAFIDAMLKAAPIVLEPIVKLEVAAPEAHIGDITGDLATKRGQINGTRALSPGTLVVLGQAPLSELNGYQSRLHALTAGHGSYLIEFSHYEPVPAAVQQQLVSQFRLREED